jgi:redox-sensitive bicupin YhaK (pirin superfamily)
VLGATLKAGESLDYELGAGRHGYLVPATGAVDVDGVALNARDGAALTGGETIRITARDDAELVMVDSE